MDVIDATDLASYLADESVETDDRAALIIELTNALLTEVVGELEEPFPVKVRLVAFEMASRAFRNPEGYSSETIDDYTYRRDAETRRAGVYLTTTELEDLQGGSRVYQGWLA